MRIQNNLLLLAGMIAFLTAAAHALIGQPHLTRVLATNVEAIDSAVIFAVWHMVTIVLSVFALGLLLLAQCKHSAVVKVFVLATGIVFFLFGVLFVVTSFLHDVAALQWIPMMIVSLLCATGYRSGKNKVLKSPE